MYQMVATYTCKLKINRWPMAFFNMLDVSALNASVTFIALFPNRKNSETNHNIRRRLFISLKKRSLKVKSNPKVMMLPVIFKEFRRFKIFYYKLIKFWEGTINHLSVSYKFCTFCRLKIKLFQFYFVFVSDVNHRI